MREVHVDPDFAQSRIALELSEARRRRGGDLQAISEELRIRYDHLLSLEEGRFDDLPGPTYVIGFLRSYAGYLDLDAEDLIHRFKTEVSNYSAQQKLHFPAPAEEGRVPTGPLLVIALALAGASYAAWYYMTSVDRLSGGVPEAPAQIAAPAPSVEPVQPTPSTTPPPESSTITAASETAAPPVVVASEPALQTQPEPTAAPETAAPEIVAAVEAEEAGPGVAAQPEATPTEEPETVVAAANATVGAPQADAEAETIAVEVAPDLTAAADAAPEAGDSADEATQTAAVESAGRVTGARRPVTTTQDLRPGEVGGAALDEIEATVTTEVVTTETVMTETVTTETVTTAAREPEGEAATNQVDGGPRAEVAEAVPQVPPPPAAVAEYVPRVFGQGNVASRISVRALQESWVQVTGIDNELLLTRILRPGDVYHVPDRPGLVLMTGNAGGIEIVVDGTVAPRLGPVAAVRRGVMLDAEKLIAGEAAIR